MSALGQKQTYAVQKGMSALPPKADSTQYPALHAAQCCLLASGFLQYAVFKRVAGLREMPANLTNGEDP